MAQVTHGVILEVLIVALVGLSHSYPFFKEQPSKGQPQEGKGIKNGTHKDRGLIRVP